ncbi:MAG TPA: cyclic nucleotide-binding domain-containing protein [Thermoanaerobaculaceae bacterium]|nr:cyclic nucleotide-binding domain-containing protein [Thermoanaerobaculaceae bacterium]
MSTGIDPTSSWAASTPVQSAHLVLLRGFSSLKHLASHHLGAIGLSGQEVCLRAGGEAYHEGEAGDDVFIVLSGSATAIRQTPLGDLLGASFVRGDIAGEVSYLDGQPRCWSLRANEPTTLLRVPGARLHELVRGEPGMALELLRTFWASLAAKVRSAYRVMNEIMAPGQHVAPRQRSGDGAQIGLSEGTKLLALRTLGFSGAELGLLATQLVAQRYEADTVIFSEGEPGDRLFVVLEGQVRISRRIPSLGEEALAILRRGDVFGEMALVDEKPRSADAIAHGDGCALLAITRVDLARAAASDPASMLGFFALMGQILCRRLRSMTEQLVAWRIMTGFG